MDAILAALEALADQRNATAAQSATTPAPVRPGAAPGVPSPVAPRPAAPAPAPPSHVTPAQHENRVPPLQGMFADGNSLLRAIIAAEVLGPPPSLKEHTFWNRQPNEP